MGKTKQQLIVDNNTSFPNNNANYITPALLRDFNRDMIDNTVNQDVYTADSGSFNQRIGDLETASSSFVTSAITASSLVTASFAAGTLTFTKGNGSTFGVVIPDITGSTIPDGTISSSAQITDLGFINSSVTSSMAVSSSLYAVTASLAREVIISAINANQSTLPIGTVVRISGANGDNPNFNTASYTDEAQSSNTLGILAHTAVSGQYADITVIGKLVGVNTAGMNAGDLLYLSSSGHFTNVQPQAPLQIVVLGEVLRVQQNNGSIFVNISNGWELNELHNVRIESPQQGDVLVYEASSSLWKNVPSSSITPTDISALNLFTASIAGTNAFTQSIQTEVNGIEAKTGSYATTGSNAFVGVQSINVAPGTGFGEAYLLGYSGSLVIGNSTSTPTYAALTHLSSSVPNANTNILIKNNTNTNPTILSGSANIFANPAAPTAGFIRYMTGGNIAVGGNGASVPQISSSMAFSPTIANNLLQTTSTPITVRGPVSSSAYTINNNIIGGGQINLGTAAATGFERATAGANISNNALFGGNLSAMANTTPLSASVTATGNLLFGSGVMLNLYSSSIGYNSNIQNGGITVSNSHLPISGSNASAQIVRASLNTLYGHNHLINYSGSNVSTTQTKHFYANILAGMFLTASLAGNTDSNNILASGMIGNYLILSGSSTAVAVTNQYSPDATQGSLVVGRFNATDGNKAKTAEMVFSVGTGTSNTNRKTGFLIDSGSNTFVEGSLNVSGSSSFTGSVNVSTTLTLGQSNPLPTGTTGMLAVSASVLWFYDATQWRQVSLV